MGLGEASDLVFIFFSCIIFYILSNDHRFRVDPHHFLYNHQGIEKLTTTKDKRVKAKQSSLIVTKGKQSFRNYS
jgi:hypothetical protein